MPRVRLLSLEVIAPAEEGRTVNHRLEQLRRRLEEIAQRLRATGLVRSADDLQQISRALRELVEAA
jgi:hypothetical protein